MGLDLVYRAWRYRLKVEPAEIAFVRRVLRPGDRAIDVGAHKGAFTYWMRSAVGASGEVIAVEPQPALATKLQRAFAASPNVKVHACGLSASAGELALNVPAGGPSPGATLEPSLARTGDVLVRVPVTTLDALALPGSVRLVKCDVEGHELSVFRGAERVLGEAKPILLFECEARHHPSGTMPGVFAHLAERGYEGWFFRGVSLSPIAAFDAALHQDPAREPYANNFVFARPEIFTA